MTPDSSRTGSLTGSGPGSDSGTLGKVGNCQIGVSISAVTDAASCSLSWRLFLPARWDDAQADGPEAAAAIQASRTRAGIPEDVRHREG